MRTLPPIFAEIADFVVLSRWRFPRTSRQDPVRTPQGLQRCLVYDSGTMHP